MLYFFFSEYTANFEWPWTERNAFWLQMVFYLFIYLFKPEVAMQVKQEHFLLVDVVDMWRMSERNSFFGQEKNVGQVGTWFCPLGIVAG